MIVPDRGIARYRFHLIQMNNEEVLRETMDTCIQPHYLKAARKELKIRYQEIEDGETT